MILLLGASGYLGQAFVAELRHRGIGFTAFSRRLVDYTRFDVLFNYVREARPDFIINAAGYPGNPVLKSCETSRAETVRANTLLPQTIARVCYLTNTPWGHVSSGLIFAGAKVRSNGHFTVERQLQLPELRQKLDLNPEDFRGFAETDEPNFTFRSPPCSFYSGTKALAEEALQGFSQFFLWRPGLVFDEVDHPRNFLTGPLNGTTVRDDVNTFSHRADFVRACLDLWDKRSPFGVYHVANPGVLTGRQVAEELERRFASAKPFRLEPDETWRNIPSLNAPRAECILDCSKLSSTGIRLRPVARALKDALENWKPLMSEPGQCHDRSNSTGTPPVKPS